MRNLRCLGLGLARRLLLLDVVPVLHPVMWAKLLPGNLPVEVLFKSQAVVRREWAQKASPWPNVAPIWIPKDSRNFRVTVSSQLQNAKVCFDLHTP